MKAKKAATPTETTETTPFARFAEFTRRVLAVPKAELDARAKAGTRIAAVKKRPTTR